MLPPDRFAPPPLMPPTSGSADGRGGKLRFIAEYALGCSPTLHHARKIANSLPSLSPKLGHSTQLHPFNNVTGLCPSCLISKSVVILDFGYVIDFKVGQSFGEPHQVSNNRFPTKLQSGVPRKIVYFHRDEILA